MEGLYEDVPGAPLSRACVSASSADESAKLAAYVEARSAADAQARGPTTQTAPEAGPALTKRAALPPLFQYQPSAYSAALLSHPLPVFGPLLNPAGHAAPHAGAAAAAAFADRRAATQWREPNR